MNEPEQSKIARIIGKAAGERFVIMQELTGQKVIGALARRGYGIVENVRADGAENEPGSVQIYPESALARPSKDEVEP